MEEELNRINNLFEENKSSLPLVLHDVEINEKKIILSGKSIKILKYGTTIYPLDKYYKHVIRIS